MRRPAIVTAGTVVLAAVAAAALGLGEPSAGCLPDGCDCEAVGNGWVRQPANAWSALALAGSGIWILATRTRVRLDAALGAAALGSGIAAFWFHASLTGWSARLDGIAVAAFVAVPAVREWSDRLGIGLPLTAASALIAVAAAAGTTLLNPATALLAVGAVAGAARPARRRGRDGRLAATAVAALAFGAALWWLGRSDGPWCDPDAVLGPHALWHVAAAVAIGTGAAYLDSGSRTTRDPTYSRVGPHRGRHAPRRLEMSRRLRRSFFNESRQRGRMFSLGPRRSALRWILPALVPIVAFAVWLWLDRTDEGASADAPLAPPPSLLVATTATTVPQAEETVGAIECPDLGTPWRTFQASGTRTGCIAAPTITQPRILWSQQVGIQRWLNNPIVVGDRVFVGSAGRVQFEADAQDQVYALDLDTGESVWQEPFRAGLDVNGVGFGDGVVVATSDDGRVYGLDAEDGREIWSDDLGASAFGNPLAVGDLAVVVDGGGGVTAFDIRTGVRAWRVVLEGPVRGGASTDGSTIYAASEGREVAAISLDGALRWKVKVTGVGNTAEDVEVFAAPTIADGLVVIPLVRDDAYPNPALIALDAETGDLRWRAADTAGIKTEWGNVRSSPAVVGEVLLYGEPYSSGLIAIGLADGETRWSVDVGPYCYPHWPSPAVVGRQIVFARHDGGLYAVDAETAQPAWSIYLGDGTEAGPFPDGYAPESDFCQWGPADGYSVLASPAISESGVVVVGTLEGYLFAVGDRSW